MTSPQPHLLPFSWERLPAMASLMNGLQGLEGTPSALDAALLEERLRAPGMDAEADGVLAAQDDALIGYTLLHWELPIGCVVLEGGVLPEHRRRGVGGALLAWALARGREAGAATTRVPAPEADDALLAFLQGRGFRPVRIHEVHRWTGAAVPAPALPPGIVSRRLRPGEEPALQATQNAAFAGQWGFSPNTVAQVAHTVGMRRTGHEGVAVLMAGDDVAAYCITQTAGQPPEAAGSVLMLGVHPRHRGVGLGRAALLAGMQLLRERGAGVIELTVDAENAAARRLYASVGFRRADARRWLEASLSPG